MSEDSGRCSPSPSLSKSPPMLQQRQVCCGLRSKDILNVAVHLLLPLSLGISTVVVTLYQQRLANEQRLEDRNTTHAQRLEDRNTAREQREQDLNMSALQREQDKLNAGLQREDAELQRAQDLNISAIRRDLDLHIAEMKQVADNTNAEKQRNMSRDQREHEVEVEENRHHATIAQRKHELELEEKRHRDSLAQRDHELDVEQKRYLDGLVLSYINDVGSVLKSINGSLISKHPTEAVLVRAKTLNIVGQLDPNRALQLIHFLYNAGQLTVNNGPLDLTGFSFNEINLRASPRMPAMKKLSLRQTFLINASFEGQDVSFWDFKGAQLTGANFARANCTQTIFEQAILVGVDFTQSILTSVKFAYVDLYGATFYQTKPVKFIFDHAKMEKVNFTGVIFHGGLQKPASTRFSQSNIANSIFVRAVLFNIRFELCNMTGANFTDSYLVESEFYANTFAFALFFNANMSTTSWYFSNMSHAEMWGADCTYACDLDESLSLYNAILPNETVGDAPMALLRSGQPKCDQNNTKGWTIRNGNIAVQQHPYEDDKKKGKCVYAPLNMDIDMKSPSMSQRIDITSFDDLTSESFSILSICARIGIQTTLHISQYNMLGALLNENNWSMKGGADKTDIVVKDMLLNKATYYLQVDIQFSSHFSITYSWIEYIELNINPLYEPLD